MTKMLARSSAVGRSTKKISSKRPLRNSSGGTVIRSFAASGVRRPPVGRESGGPALQPRLQPREAADLEAVLLHREELQDAAALDHLALAADHRLDVVAGQATVGDDGLRDDLPRLIER